MSLVSVEGFDKLMKDTSSGGVVNTDRRAYENYLKTKQIATNNILQQQATQESVVEMQNEINNIKSDLTDIKELLVQLMNKG